MEEDEPLPPGPPPMLSRSSSSFVAKALLDEGVPVYMARRAALMVGNDEKAQREFVLANADQPEIFWHSNFKQDNQIGGVTERLSSVGEDRGDLSSLQLKHAETAANKWMDTIKKRKHAKIDPRFEEGLHRGQWSHVLKVQPAFDVMCQVQQAQLDVSDWFTDVIEGDLIDVNLDKLPHMFPHDMIEVSTIQTVKNATTDATESHDKASANDANDENPLQIVSETIQDTNKKNSPYGQDEMTASAICTSCSKSLSRVLGSAPVTVCNTCGMCGSCSANGYTYCERASFREQFSSTSVTPAATRRGSELWAQAKVQRASTIKFMPQPAPLNSKLLYFNVYNMSKFGDIKFMIRKSEVKDSVTFEVGNQVTFAASSSEVDFTDCPGPNKLSFQAGTSYFIEKIKGGFFTTSVFINLWAPLSALVGWVPRQTTKSASTSPSNLVEVAVLGEGYGYNEVFTVSGKLCEGGKLLKLSLDSALENHTTSTKLTIHLNTDESEKSKKMKSSTSSSLKVDFEAYEDTVNCSDIALKGNFMTSSEVKSFVETEKVWRRLKVAFLSSIKLKQFRQDYYSKYNNIEKPGGMMVTTKDKDLEAAFDENGEGNVLSEWDFLLPCWENHTIRKPSFKKIDQIKSSANNTSSNKKTKLESVEGLSEKHVGFFYTDVSNKIGSNLAVRAWTHTSLRVELKENGTVLLIPLHSMALSKQLVPKTSTPLNEHDLAEVDTLRSKSGAVAVASSLYPKAKTEDASITKDTKADGDKTEVVVDSWGQFHSLIKDKFQMPSLAPVPTLKETGSDDEEQDAQEMVQEEMVQYRVPEHVVVKHTSVRAEWVIGTVVSSSLWLNQESSVVAIAITPGNVLNDYSPKPPKNLLSAPFPSLKSASSPPDISTTTANTTHEMSHYSEESSDEEEEEVDYFDGFQAPMYSPTSANVADPDPVLSATGMRLVDWSFMLLFDPASACKHQSDDNEDGVNFCWDELHQWLYRTLVPILRVQESRVAARQLKWSQKSNKERKERKQLSVDKKAADELAKLDAGLKNALAPAEPVVFCDENEWSCAACTFVNPTTEDICSVCETGRPPVPTTDNAMSDGANDGAVPSDVHLLTGKENKYYLCVSTKPLSAVSGYTRTDLLSSSKVETVKNSRITISRGEILLGEVVGEGKWLKVNMTPPARHPSNNSFIHTPNNFLLECYVKLYDEMNEPLFVEEETGTMTMGAIVKVRSLEQLSNDLLKHIPNMSIKDAEAKNGKVGTVVDIKQGLRGTMIKVKYHPNNQNEETECVWPIAFVTRVCVKELNEFNNQQKLQTFNCCVINDVRHGMQSSYEGDDGDAEKEHSRDEKKITHTSDCACLVDVPVNMMSSVVNVLKHISEGKFGDNVSSSSSTSSEFGWLFKFQEAEKEALRAAHPPPFSFKLVPLMSSFVNPDASLKTSLSSAAQLSPLVSFVRTVVPTRADMNMPGPVRSNEYPVTACSKLPSTLVTQANDVLQGENKVFGRSEDTTETSSLSSQHVPNQRRDNEGDTGIVLVMTHITPKLAKDEIAMMMLESEPNSLLNSFIVMTQTTKTSTSNPCSLGDAVYELYRQHSVESGLVVSMMNKNAFVIDRENLDAFSHSSTPFSIHSFDGKVKPAIIWNPSASSSQGEADTSMTSNASSMKTFSTLTSDSNYYSPTEVGGARGVAPQPGQPNYYRALAQRRAHARARVREQRNNRNTVSSKKVDKLLELLEIQPLTLVEFGCAEAQALPNITKVASDVSDHFAECMVCFELKIFPSFIPFCFKDFRVTGDSMTKNGPRHPNSICQVCLEQHARSAVKGGKLFVRCPYVGCGRSLQTLELKNTLPDKEYNDFVKALKEAEEYAQKSNQEDDEVTLATMGIQGLELRMCPACSIRIEKNEGCSSMVCYRCGENFSWSSATLVKTSKVKQPVGGRILTANDIPSISQEIGRVLHFTRSAASSLPAEFIDGPVTVRGVNANAFTTTVNVSWEGTIPMFQTVQYHELSYPVSSAGATAVAATVGTTASDDTVDNAATETAAVATGITVNTEDEVTGDQGHHVIAAAEFEQIQPGTILEFVRPSDAFFHAYSDQCTNGRVIVMSAPQNGHAMVGWLNSTHSFNVLAADLRRPSSFVAPTPAATNEVVGTVGVDENAVTQEVGVEVDPALRPRITLQHIMSDKNPVRALENYLNAVEQSYIEINVDDVSLEKKDIEVEEGEENEEDKLLELTSNMSIPVLEYAAAFHKGLEMVSESPMSLASYMVFEDMIQDLFGRLGDAYMSLQANETLPTQHENFQIVAEVQGEVGEDAKCYLCCLNGDDNHQMQSKGVIVKAGYGETLTHWLALSEEERNERSVKYMNFQHKYRLISTTFEEPVSGVGWNVITADQISTAVKLVFPGELAKLAVEAGDSVVSSLKTELSSAEEMEVEGEEGEAPKMQFLLNNYQAFKEQEESTGGDDEGGEDEDEDEKDLYALMYTLGSLAKLTFPAVHVGKKLVRSTGRFISLSAAVYLAAVLDYIMLEFLECSAKACEDLKDTIITPKHIALVISKDAELDTLAQGACILGGGVREKLHPMVSQGTGMSFSGMSDGGVFIAAPHVAAENSTETSQTEYPSTGALDANRPLLSTASPNDAGLSTRQVADSAGYLTNPHVFSSIDYCFKQQETVVASNMGETATTTITATTEVHDSSSITTEDATDTTDATRNTTDIVAPETAETAGTVEVAKSNEEYGACFLGGEGMPPDPISGCNFLARLPHIENKDNNHKQLELDANVVFCEWAVRALAAKAGAVKLDPAVVLQVRSVGLLWLDHVIRNAVLFSDASGSPCIDLSGLLASLSNINSLSLSSITVWGTGRHRKFLPVFNSKEFSDDAEEERENEETEVSSQGKRSAPVEENSDPSVKRSRNTSHEDGVQEEEGSLSVLDEQEDDDGEKKNYKVLRSGRERVGVVHKTMLNFYEDEAEDEQCYLSELLEKVGEGYLESEWADSFVLPLLLIEKNLEEDNEAKGNEIAPQDGTNPPLSVSLPAASAATSSGTGLNPSNSVTTVRPVINASTSDRLNDLMNPMSQHQVSVDMVRVAQSMLGPVLPFLPLASLVTLIARDYCPHPVVCPAMVRVLSEALQQYLISVISSAQVGCLHANRYSIKVSDFSTVRYMRGERSARSYQTTDVVETATQEPSINYSPRD